MLFHDLLVDANSKVNLTKVLDWPEVVLRHYLDSLSVVMAVPSLFDERESMLDIGSGFGMPGIPLKVMFPGNDLVMLDSVKKKVDFIDFAVKEMNLTNVDTVVGRAEDIAKNRKHREKYSVVVSRAVATLPVLLEFALPFCSVEGTFIAMKSSRVQSEIDRSENALNLLGGQIDSVVNVEDKAFDALGFDPVFCSSRRPQYRGGNQNPCQGGASTGSPAESLGRYKEGRRQGKALALGGYLAHRPPDHG